MINSFYSQRHGLKSKKLAFYDLLQTLAFKHCDGVVDIQMAPASDSTDAVSRTGSTLNESFQWKAVQKTSAILKNCYKLDKN